MHEVSRLSTAIAAIAKMQMGRAHSYTYTPRSLWIERKIKLFNQCSFRENLFFHSIISPYSTEFLLQQK